MKPVEAEKELKKDLLRMLGILVRRNRGRSLLEVDLDWLCAKPWRGEYFKECVRPHVRPHESR